MPRPIPPEKLEDVAFLRDSPLIVDDTEIRGFVYDVETRGLTEIT